MREEVSDDEEEVPTLQCGVQASRTADNLPRQDFTAEGLNERWASDITCIPTQQGWLYLAMVMDLCSRRLVGWLMSRCNSHHQVIDALNMAIGQRLPGRVLIHHSDRGAQYTGDDFRDELSKHGIRCSMRARGNCYDNAVVESCFGLLKRERVNRTRCLLRDEVRADILTSSSASAIAIDVTAILAISVRLPLRSVPKINNERSTRQRQDQCL